jgi:EAL domain-containing protein (putative c-di-GMP-specific phosphodiesterase class I)
MAEACRTAASWPEHISVSVNLSAQQFARPGIADMVAATLEESGLAPHRLLLEITESVLLVGADPVLTELVQLKQLGARIVMDDFGTGYSSLSYLWQFPFDKIKIDGSFVVALDAPGSPAEKIMRTITGLGHSLGMAVCVEGVETERQAERVRTLGCDEIQGFYFARPLSGVDLPALIMSDFRRSVDIHGEPDEAQTAARFDPAKSRKAIAAGA